MKWNVYYKDGNEIKTTEVKSGNILDAMYVFYHIHGFYEIISIAREI